MRCEKRDGRIAPIVNAARRAILRIELEHGKKLDSGDAQVLEIGNLLNESTECAACRFRDAGARMLRKSFYVHFVDDRLRRWPSEWRVAFPVVQTCIHDHAFHRRGSIVAFLLRGFTGVVSRNCDSATIRVEQDLRRIKTQPFGRIEWPVNPVRIQLPRLQPRNEDMPVVIRAVDGLVQPDHVRGPPVIFAIEDQQFDTRSVA